MKLNSKISNFNLYKSFWKINRIYACLSRLSLPYLHVMKQLICKIFGHKYIYNFGWAPNRCKCSRCGLSWKTIKNPHYIPGKTIPLSEDLEIWVEDKNNGKSNR